MPVKTIHAAAAQLSSGPLSSSAARSPRPQPRDPSITVPVHRNTTGTAVLFRYGRPHGHRSPSEINEPSAPATRRHASSLRNVDDRNTFEQRSVPLAAEPRSFLRVAPSFRAPDGASAVAGWSRPPGTPLLFQPAHRFAQQILVAALLFAAACRGSATSATSRHGAPSQPGSVALEFAPIAGLDWVDQTAASGSGSVVIEANAGHLQLHVISDHVQAKTISRRLDASAFRGTRVLASVQTAFRPHQAPAFAAVRISVERAGWRPDAWDSSTSQPLTGTADTDLEAALDVPGDATWLEVELGVNGDADARFEAPRLSIVATPPIGKVPLIDEATSALQSLAQLVGYLRFFHPSDEVARLEWTTFEAEAVHRLLAAPSRAGRRDVLRWVVSSVAPTARLYEEAHPPAPAPPPRGSGTKLTRWIRIGGDDNGNSYLSFRTEISEPSPVGINLEKTAPAQGCKHATVRLAATARQGSSSFELHIIPREGSGSPSMISHVIPAVGSIDGDIPAEATEITYGVRIGGEGPVELSEVELTCGPRTLASFSTGGDPQIWGTGSQLYSVTPSKGCAGCFAISRSPEDSYQLSRDELDVALGLGLRLRMPLALWTDGKQTFPAAPAPTAALHRHPFPPGDPASRIASAIDIWAKLRWTYPYFEVLHISWDHALTEALAASARATSADALLAALSHLVAELRDDHAEVYHPDYGNGVIPLAFHYLDSKLYVVNGVGEYRSVLPRGSILDSLDGVSADAVIAELASTISAATPAWLHAKLALVLGDGPLGAMASVRVRQPDGKLVTVRVPRVARRAILDKHEERPANGSEVATGIYYVDLAKIDRASWKALLPKLSASRGLICDARVFRTPPDAFYVLAHFIDHEIKSPYWDMPIASMTEQKYERWQASMYPLPPHLSAKLVFIVDGRTTSASETILQYTRAAGVGIVVGEPTGATNGNVASFESLGALHVRFTGMRVLNQDGSEFHGRGITPDLIVHPTVDGIRAGRDELLEAAVARITAP